jgi:RNA polymerase sigma-70 factor (ECF subfamily)
VLQARIAALHLDEPQDWPRLAALDGELADATGSPIVALNQAAAMAEGGEVEEALTLVERLELEQHHYLHSTRADLLRRIERAEEARRHTVARSSSCTRTPSAASSSGASRSSRPERSFEAPPGQKLRPAHAPPALGMP